MSNEINLFRTDFLLIPVLIKKITDIWICFKLLLYFLSCDKQNTTRFQGLKEILVAVLQKLMNILGTLHRIDYFKRNVER